MTQQPDKFFQSKLENYTKPAPPMAWDKIEARLAKSRYAGLWFKVAAGLALLAVATIILWPVGSHNDSTQIAQTKPGQVQDLKNPPKQTNSVLTNEDVLKTEKQQHGEPSVKVDPKTTRLKEQRVFNPVEKPVEQNQPIQIAITSPTVETAIQKENTSVTLLAIDKSQSNTIIYSAEEVNEKFLKKNFDEATSNEKKPSGIQKLLTLAADIKNTDSGFGELREKKNEILALNFRENKRGQNK